MLKTAVILFLVFLPVVRSFGIDLRTAAQDANVVKYNIASKDRPGICIEILYAIEKIDPEIRFIGKDKYVPLKRIEEGLSKGELDTFAGFLKTPEREEKMIYSKSPLYPVKLKMAVAVNDKINVKSFEDIRKLGDKGIVSTVQWTAYETYLKREKGIIVDSGANDLETNFRKLISGRVRFHYNSESNLIIMNSKEEFKGKFRILPTVFGVEEQYMTFSKTLKPEIIQRINKDIEKLKTQGVLDSILKKYSP